MRKIVRAALRHLGYELCRLSPEEQADLPQDLPRNYKDIQVYKALTAQGQISMAGARFLTELVRSSDPARPIVEIGCLYGYSTLVICLAKHPEQTLYTVDNFSWNSLGISPQTHLCATRNRLQECIETQRLHLVTSSAAEFYAHYTDAPPALFFCDADHTYEAVAADIAWAKSVGASIICGDDYAPEHKGVVPAVDEHGGPSEVHGRLWKL